MGIWKCQTRSVYTGLKMNKYYKILVWDFKELPVCSQTEHACMLKRYGFATCEIFSFLLNITLPNRSSRYTSMHCCFEITQGEILLAIYFPRLSISNPAEITASLIAVSFVASLFSLSSPISFLLWKNTIEAS